MRVKSAPRKAFMMTTAAVGAAVVVVVRSKRTERTERSEQAERTGESTGEHGRWHVVTVCRPRAELMPDGKLPPPLDALGDEIEIRTSDAPGGRGTEIAARSTTARGAAEAVKSVAGASVDQRIRQALREFKQLAETSEVLRVEGQPEGRRRPGGFPLGRAGRRAAKEGLL